MSVELYEQNISMEHLKCSKYLPSAPIYFLSFSETREYTVSQTRLLSSVSL